MLMGVRMSRTHVIVIVVVCHLVPVSMSVGVVFFARDIVVGVVLVRHGNVKFPVVKIKLYFAKMNTN
jgi:hypothetical protein